MTDQDQATRFEEWLRQYGGIVLKVARAYTLSVEEREDLTQEILLQIWRSLPQFQNRSTPSTWCYRVALNTALGWQRKEGRRRARHEPWLAADELPGEGSDYAVNFQQRELVERLYAAIHQLPKADTALVLLYLDGLSYREMAEVLGLTESNVGVKLNRARKALGELMKEVPHES